MPDIIAGVEQDEFGERAAKDLTGRVWKAFKVNLVKLPCQYLMICF